MSIDELKAQNHDLNRYKEVVYQEETHELPKVILGKLKALENEIGRPECAGRDAMSIVMKSLWL